MFFLVTHVGTLCLTKGSDVYVRARVPRGSGSRGSQRGCGVLALPATSSGVRRKPGISRGPRAGKADASTRGPGPGSGRRAPGEVRRGRAEEGRSRVGRVRGEGLRGGHRSRVNGMRRGKLGGEAAKRRAEPRPSPGRGDVPGPCPTSRHLPTPAALAHPRHLTVEDQDCARREKGPWRLFCGRGAERGSEAGTCLRGARRDRGHPELVRPFPPSVRPPRSPPAGETGALSRD